MLPLMREIRYCHAGMSREIILGLLDDVDERSQEFRAFIRRLGENVGKFKPEWMEALSGSIILARSPDSDDFADDGEMDDDSKPFQEPPIPEIHGWMMKAVLSVLGHMCALGPQGGLPPVQAVCKAMLSKERNGKSLGTDEDWMLYFLKVFHREQKKHLTEVLGEGGSGELRRRLLKALRQSGTTTQDDIHFGLTTATIMGIEVLTVTEAIGTRAAGGNSRSHEGAMPTVGQLREMIGDVLHLFSRNAPSFSNWMAIATRVFNLELSQPSPPHTPVDVDDDRDKGLVPDEATTDPSDAGAMQASHADVSEARSLIEDVIAELDGSPFPEGLHGRTFVEFLLFADRGGENRVTQWEYANRTGVSDGTVAYRRDAIFRALRDHQLDQFDSIAICGAFVQMEEAYRDHHLRIFGA